MAANLAAFNNYLQNVLLIDYEDVRGAINDQGITAFDDLTHRSDKYVQELFTKVRNPGGLIPNPGAAANANAPAMIPNRGVSVGVNLELRVRQLRYFLFHMYRIQRPFTTAFATLARLKRAWALKERIKRVREANKDLPKVDVLLKVDHVRKAVEDIDEILNNRLGAYGSPLSYLIRDAVVPDEATDAGFI